MSEQGRATSSGAPGLPPRIVKKLCSKWERSLGGSNTGPGMNSGSDKNMGPFENVPHFGNGPTLVYKAKGSVRKSSALQRKPASWNMTVLQPQAKETRNKNSINHPTSMFQHCGVFCKCTRATDSFSCFGETWVEPLQLRGYFLDSRRQLLKT